MKRLMFFLCWLVSAYGCSEFAVVKSADAFSNEPGERVIRDAKSIVTLCSMGSDSSFIATLNANIQALVKSGNIELSSKRIVEGALLQYSKDLPESQRADFMKAIYPQYIECVKSVGVN